MKKLFLMLGLVCCNACATDSCNDIAQPVFAEPAVALTFVDAEGNNLFENGTFEIDQITVDSANFGLVTPPFDDTFFFIPYANITDIYSYQINLSDNETSVFVLDITERSVRSDNGCYDVPAPQINEADYNGNSQEIIDNSITIVLAI